MNTKWECYGLVGLGYEAGRCSVLLVLLECAHDRNRLLFVHSLDRLLQMVLHFKDRLQTRLLQRVYFSPLPSEPTWTLNLRNGAVGKLNAGFVGHHRAWTEPVGEGPVLVVEPSREDIRDDGDGGVVSAVRREVGVVRVHEGGVARDLALSRSEDADIAMLVGHDGEENGEHDQTRDRDLLVIPRSRRNHLHEGETLGEKSEHEDAHHFEYAARKKRNGNDVVGAAEDEEGNDGEHEGEHGDKHRNVLLTRFDKGSANPTRHCPHPFLHLHQRYKTERSLDTIIGLLLDCGRICYEEIQQFLRITSHS